MNARQRRRERRIDARIDAGIARGIEAHEAFKQARVEMDRAVIVQSVEALFREKFPPDLHHLMPRVAFR